MKKLYFVVIGCFLLSVAGVIAATLISKGRSETFRLQITDFVDSYTWENTNNHDYLIQSVSFVFDTSAANAPAFKRISGTSTNTLYSSSSTATSYRQEFESGVNLLARGETLLFTSGLSNTGVVSVTIATDRR